MGDFLHQDLLNGRFLYLISHFDPFFGNAGKTAQNLFPMYLFLEPVNPVDEDRVFLNSEGFPITHTTVEKLFQRVKQRAEIARFHPHACWHTFAVRYLIHGGDAFSFQKILGHTSLEMTRK